MIFGALGIVEGLAAVTFGAFLATSGAVLGGLFSPIGLLVPVVGVLEVVFAGGAWLLRRWAWRLGVSVSIAALVIDALWMLAGAAVGPLLVAMTVSLALLYCLDTVPVRRVFHQLT